MVKCLGYIFIFSEKSAVCPNGFYRNIVLVYENNLFKVYTGVSVET